MLTICCKTVKNTIQDTKVTMHVDSERRQMQHVYKYLVLYPCDAKREGCQIFFKAATK